MAASGKRYRHAMPPVILEFLLVAVKAACKPLARRRYRMHTSFSDCQVGEEQQLA